MIIFLFFKCLLIERNLENKSGEKLPAAKRRVRWAMLCSFLLGPWGTGEGLSRAAPLARGWSPGSSSEETDAASSRPHPGSAHQNASLPAGPLVLVGSQGAAGPRLFKGGTPPSVRRGWREPVEKYCPACPRREPKEPLRCRNCLPGTHGCLCSHCPQHGPCAPAGGAEGPWAGAPQQGRGHLAPAVPGASPSLSPLPCCVGPQL